jgi:hypothetical protein
MTTYLVDILEGVYEMEEFNFPTIVKLIQLAFSIDTLLNPRED